MNILNKPIDYEVFLKILGIRYNITEEINVSVNDIFLYYKEDQEAFDLLEDKYKDKCAEIFYKERKYFEAIYLLLLDHFDNPFLVDCGRNELKEIINKHEDIPEPDKDFRDEYFFGKERTLLRYYSYELITPQRRYENDHNGIIKDSYLLELSGKHQEAIMEYLSYHLQKRIDICKYKKNIEEIKKDINDYSINEMKLECLAYNPYVEFLLGYIYTYGTRGEERNQELGLSYLYKACINGSGEAMYLLSVLYMNPNWIKRSETLAMKFLMCACSMNLPKAQKKLFS